MRRKGQVINQLLPILIVPLVLLIVAAVFTSFTSSTVYVFEEAIVNESLGTGTTVYTAYPCKDASVTQINNKTHTQTAVTQYNVSYTPFGKATITLRSDVSGGVNASYTAYTGSGYETFEKTRTGTWGGFKLASLLPYIIAAVVVLGVLLGAFVARGI